MVLLIDPPLVPWRGRMWSHLVSDLSLEELHLFAAGLGVPRRAFSNDHYDVPSEVFDLAVEAGAHVVRSRVIVQRLSAAGLRHRPHLLDC
ncbi:DUF4031 domain-containing protein [Nocardioides sp. BGMRC 2183]|nr:DUF4031 domain-containing protein [Nocardioides sp. BGMRC 2183]